MAGHSHSANIKHRKSAQDAKKSTYFTKLINTVYTCAKNGSTDPEINTSLRFAIQQAQSASVPKNKIENAINRASGVIDGKQLESIRYNASIGAILLIIDCLTTNRNRTASDIRCTVAKHGASIIDNGGAEFMFDNVGWITYPIQAATEEEMMNAALQAGCNDFSISQDCYNIVTHKQDLHKVTSELKKIFGNVLSISLIWHPKSPITINTEDETEKVFSLIDALESCIDVNGVFTNAIRKIEQTTQQ